jgi:hypothetical protein
MEKMTKKQMFEQIMSHLNDENERKFIEHEIELLDKKNARKSTKPTANQEANMDIKDAIVEWLTENGEPMTVTEMMKTIPACADASNQKLSALLRQLRVEEVVKSEKVKGTTYFSLI